MPNKPNTPLKQDGKEFYPLTDSSQVIIGDTRLDAELNSIKTDIGTAQSTAEAAMPQSGGQFSNIVKASQTVATKEDALKNIRVCNSSGTAQGNSVSSISIIMQRK